MSFWIHCAGRREGAHESPLERSHPASAKNARHRKSAPLKVLIVDDSPLMLSVLREYFLTEPAIQVVGTAADGAAALKKVKSLRPQLVLMDLHMPHLDGLAATRIIRQRFPNVRVLIMTLDLTAQIRKDCRAAGAQGFVSKLSWSRHLGPAIHRVFPE